MHPSLFMANLPHQSAGGIGRDWLCSSMVVQQKCISLRAYMDFPVAQTVKHLPAIRNTWVQSLVGKIPWRREWPPTPVFLPGKSYGQKSLVGCNPKGCTELDWTEQQHACMTLCYTCNNYPHFTPEETQPWIS